MDPWAKNIDATCEFPSGHSVFVPFAHGWCDNGNIGYYNVSSVAQLKPCLSDVNSGEFTITENFENTTDIKSIVTINPDTSIVVKQNPASAILKIVDIRENPFNVTIKPETRYKEFYESPKDFAFSPKTYKAIGQCLCGIINSTLLTPGIHTLEYHVIYKYTNSNIDKSDVKYTFIIK
jgi:hypothetical protein